MMKISRDAEPTSIEIKYNDKNGLIIDFLDFHITKDLIINCCMFINAYAAFIIIRLDF